MLQILALAVRVAYSKYGPWAPDKALAPYSKGFTMYVFPYGRGRTVDGWSAADICHIVDVQA